MLETVFKSLRHHSLFKNLRHCALCQLSHRPNTWLCTRCFTHLKQNFLEPKHMVRLHGSYLHIRLIDWHDENDKWMRLLIQSLKGDYESPLFDILSQEFWHRLRQIPSISRDVPFCFIPCPAKSFKQDHGVFFCAQLSRHMRFPMRNILQHCSSNSNQKNKNILLRRQKIFKLIDKESIPKDHSLVFVDDVLTTGSTALAAYKALGKPQPFMAWSLFYRRYSENNERF